MLKVLLLAAVIILSPVKIFAAPHFEIQPTGTTNTLRGITFIDQNTGICVGGSSTILRTTNGGTNWVNIDVSTSAAYYTCVAFVNPTTAFVTSDSGQVLKTTNAGLNWTISNFTTTPLKYVYFLNSSLGFIGGANSKLFRTTNGGTNWNDVSLGNAEQIIRINFLDENFGMLLTREYLNPGSVYKTSNGGVSWQKLDSFYSGYTGDKALFDIVPLSRDTIYVALGYYQTGIMRTTNGGENWTRIYNQFQTIVYPGSLYELFFIDRNILIAMNGPTDGAPCYLIKSTNGGFNFTHPSAIRLAGYMYDGYFFRSNQTAYFCGESGIISKLYSYLTNIQTQTSSLVSREELTISPNPGGNFINIKSSSANDNLDNYSIKIYDLQGREVKSFSVNSSQSSIDISLLPKSIYLIKIINGSNEFYLKKFVKIF